MAGSAEDAKHIHESLDAAFWDIQRARRTVDYAIRLIHEGEPDAKNLAPSVEAIRGSLDVTRLALINSLTEWRGYAQAREQG